MNRKLWLLLVVHVIAGIFLSTSVWACPQGSSYLGPRDIGLIVVLAVVYCQSCLLALWAALSHAAPWKRMVGLVCGTIYLDILVPASLSTRVPFFLHELPVFLTVIVTASLLVVRFRGFEFLRIIDGLTDQNRWGLQFSIRGVMLWTFAMAALIASVKGLRQLAPPLDEGFFLSTLSASFAVIGVASLWATLGAPPPIARSITVILVPPLLDAIVSFAAGITHWYAVFIILFITLLQTLALLGSLLVIRSCGYRLVKRERNAAAAVSS
jgi:hypothetical protein